MGIAHKEDKWMTKGPGNVKIGTHGKIDKVSAIPAGTHSEHNVHHDHAFHRTSGQKKVVNGLGDKGRG